METNNNFNKIYVFVFTMSLLVMAYVLLITFLPIPEKNQRFVDIALAFLLGHISSNSSYLTGGNPAQHKKPEATPGTTNIELTATSTTTEEPANKE